MGINNEEEEKHTSFAIRQAILEIKVAVTEQSAAVGAGEAFRVELLSDGIQTILYNKRSPY